MKIVNRQPVIEPPSYAFTAVVHDGCCMVARADLDVAGYTPLPGHGRFEQYNHAKSVADALNQSIGHDAVSAVRVVISSIAAQHRRDKEAGLFR